MDNPTYKINDIEVPQLKSELLCLTQSTHWNKYRIANIFGFAPIFLKMFISALRFDFSLWKNELLLEAAYKYYDHVVVGSLSDGQLLLVLTLLCSRLIYDNFSIEQSYIQLTQVHLIFLIFFCLSGYLIVATGTDQDIRELIMIISILLSAIYIRLMLQSYKISSIFQLQKKMNLIEMGK